MLRKRSWLSVGDIRMRAWLVSIPMSTVLVYSLVARRLSQDYFFDEMWRVDYLRSADPFSRYLTHDTPLPPGWVVLFSPIGHLTDNPWLIRSISVLGFVAFLAGAMALTLVCIAPNGLSPRELRRRVVVCLATTLSLASIPFLVDLAGWVNNYTFEAAYQVWLLVCIATVDRWRWSWIMSLVLIALGPVFTIAPVFSFPAIVAYFGYRAWSDRRTGRLVALTASAVVSLASLASVYLLLYRRVVPPRFGFWAPFSLRAAPEGPWQLIRASASHFLAATYAGLFPTPPTLVRAVLAAVVLALLAAGLLVLGQGRRCLPAVLGATCVTTAIASIATDWPIGAVRVNASLVGLLFLVIVVAAYVVVDRLVRLETLTILTFAVVVSVSWGNAPHPSGVPFAVGLRSDMSPIADSPTSSNLVLSYHFMTQFYADDFLINDRHGHRDYVVVRDVRGDRALYGDLSAYLDHVPPGGMAWCVIPYVVGPTDFASACQVNRPDMHLVLEEHGAQAVIRGYVREMR